MIRAKLVIWNQSCLMFLGCSDQLVIHFQECLPSYISFICIYPLWLDEFWEESTSGHREFWFLLMFWQFSPFILFFSTNFYPIDFISFSSSSPLSPHYVWDTLDIDLFPGIFIHRQIRENIHLFPSPFSSGENKNTGELYHTNTNLLHCIAAE